MVSEKNNKTEPGEFAAAVAIPWYPALIVEYRVQKLSVYEAWMTDNEMWYLKQTSGNPVIQLLCPI